MGTILNVGQCAMLRELLASSRSCTATMLGDVPLVRCTRLPQSRFRSVLLAAEQLVVRTGGRSGKISELCDSLRNAKHGN